MLPNHCQIWPIYDLELMSRIQMIYNLLCSLHMNIFSRERSYFHGLFFTNTTYLATIHRPKTLPLVFPVYVLVLIRTLYTTIPNIPSSSPSHPNLLRTNQSTNLKPSSTAHPTSTLQHPKPSSKAPTNIPYRDPQVPVTRGSAKPCSLGKPLPSSDMGIFAV